MLTRILQPMIKPIISSVFGGGTLLLIDTFTAPNDTTLNTYTGEHGYDWVQQPNNNIVTQAIIHNNRVVAQANNNTYKLDYVMPSANYEVEGAFVCLTNLGVAGVLARSNVANFYTLRYANAGTLQLQKVKNGVITVLGTMNTTFVSGQTYVLKLVCNGDNLEGWINGVLSLTATDSELTDAGSIGLRIPGGVTTTTGIHCDKIEVRLL